MKHHPAADVFPMMDDMAFADLKSDIAKNGQYEPVWLYRGELLDGRNRYKACMELGLRPETREYRGDSPAAFVWSLNGQRRHMTATQKAFVGERLLPMLEAEAKERQAATLKQNATVTAKIPERAKGESREKAAEIVGVNPRYISDAKRIRESDPGLAEACESGAVTISQAKKKIKQKERKQRIIDSCVAVEIAGEKKYPLIYADPPWRYEYCQSGSRQIENQYPTMSIDEICDLEVERAALPDCILFMWTTSPKLRESFDVLDAWGFTYRTCAVWDKEKIGMGYYFRQQHELLLIATRGSIPTPEESSRVGSIFKERRGKHSAKPEIAYQIIERMYPDFPKLELFARIQRDGWDSWGNQA